MTTKIGTAKHAEAPIVQSSSKSSYTADTLKNLFQQRVQQIETEKQLDAEWIKVEHEDDDFEIIDSQYS